MTKHLAAQPDHCLQCLRPFPPDKLNHGRCGTCRARTPAAIWNMHHERAMTAHRMRLDVFRDGNAYRPPLVSTLFSVEEMDRIIAEAEEKSLTMLPGGRVMESFRRGEFMVCRYTFPVVPENNPFAQTAEDLIRNELKPKEVA